MDLKNFKKEITKQIISDITEQVHKELNLSKNGTRKNSVVTNPSEEEDLDGAGIKHLAHHLHKNIKNTINRNHVGRKLKNTAINHVVPIAKDMTKTVLKDSAMAIAMSNPELAPLLPVANYTIDKAIGSGMGIKKPRKKREQSQKEKNRHELVKNLMKENNMTLPQASSYIKNNNLNY